MIGMISNADELIEKYLNDIGGHFDAMTNWSCSSTDLLSALINQRKALKKALSLHRKKLRYCFYFNYDR